MALEQNQEVFAVPSPIGGARPSGTNRLIRQRKALLVESVDDIIAELGPRLIGIREGGTATATAAGAGQTLFERRLCDIVGDAPLPVDLIAQRSGISAAEAMVHLLALEYKGAVRQLAGKRFVKA
jgi:DNA processing protein